MNEVEDLRGFMVCDSCKFETNDCEAADFHELEQPNHLVRYSNGD